MILDLICNTPLRQKPKGSQETDVEYVIGINT